MHTSLGVSCSETYSIVDSHRIGMLSQNIYGKQAGLSWPITTAIQILIENHFFLMAQRLTKTQLDFQALNYGWMLDWQLTPLLISHLV